MEELRIIIAGSRNFDDYEILKTEVVNIVKYFNRPRKYIKIISGGAKGADKLGEKFAEEYQMQVKRFIPDWDGLGRRAGVIRNDEMARYAVADNSKGMLIAFWDGESRGTMHMINLAKKHGLMVHIIKFKRDSDVISLMKD